ncbi:hypothetical protein JTB14_031607 [Gonioctena quinquepunctata]|nr:hypothetical protein JTB14_031607 [Gonioctena quinquepunctata]
MTKQHLYPTFPVLPTVPLVNGGYYGIINPPPPAQPQLPHSSTTHMRNYLVWVLQQKRYVLRSQMQPQASISQRYPKGIAT